MSSFPIHFIRPLWLLLLPVVLFIVFWHYQHQHQRNPWQAVCDPNLLTPLLTTHPTPKKWLPWLILAGSEILILLALAGPSFKQIPQPTYRLLTPRVFVLDLSPSMQATDLTPNRYTKAKYKLLDLLNAYPESLAGLVVFSRHAFIAAPLTQDIATIAALVPFLSPNIMPAMGNDITDGLVLAEKLLRQANLQSGQIILLTDTMPGPNTFQFAKKLRQAGYTLDILGIGETIPSPSTAPTSNTTSAAIASLPITQLRQLATAGGGRYATWTPSDADLKHLQLVNTQTNAIKTRANTLVWQDDGYFFLYGALLLIALLFRQGWWQQWRS